MFNQDIYSLKVQSVIFKLKVTYETYDTRTAVIVLRMVTFLILLTFCHLIVRSCCHLQTGVRN